MKLIQVEIENFRCFEQVRVPLEADAMAYYRDRRNCPPQQALPDGLVELAESAPAFFRAFNAAADYPAAERWFFARENEELREQRAQKDFDFALPDLAAIRRALAGMLDGMMRMDVHSELERTIARLRASGHPDHISALRRLAAMRLGPDEQGRLKGFFTVSRWSSRCWAARRRRWWCSAAAWRRCAGRSR
jgi:hypothetical protein